MSNLIKGQNNDFIETDCVFNFNNHSFEAGGSYMVKNKKTNLLQGILYLFEEKSEHPTLGKCTNYFIGTWDGSIKVHAVRTGYWKSNWGDERSSFFFIWDKIKFYGINAGDNDIVRCKQYKNQI